MTGRDRITFFITGASSGFGRAFTEAFLAAGHTVVATVRRADDAADIESLAPGRAHARILDVTDDEAVTTTVAEVERTVGAIDVVVANAGYGLEGTMEETPLSEFRRQFDVNVFGAVAMAKAVLPHMRARRSGRIVFITSMGGLVTMPGLTAYNGSKFALEGIAEALGKEVAGLGIHVTAVAPGSFRTDWAGRSMVRTPLVIPDYEPVFGPLRANRLAASGNQLGDPAKAAAALLTIVESPHPPAHLILGSDALRLVDAARDAVASDLETWAEVSRSTDIEGGASIR